MVRVTLPHLVAWGISYLYTYIIIRIHGKLNPVYIFKLLKSDRRFPDYWGFRATFKWDAGGGATCAYDTCVPHRSMSQSALGLANQTVRHISLRAGFHSHCFFMHFLNDTIVQAPRSFTKHLIQHLQSIPAVISNWPVMISLSLKHTLHVSHCFSPPINNQYLWSLSASVVCQLSHVTSSLLASIAKHQVIGADVAV